MRLSQTQRPIASWWDCRLRTTSPAEAAVSSLLIPKDIQASVVRTAGLPNKQQSSGFCPNLPLLSTAVPQDLRGISQSPHSSTSSHQNVKRLGSLMTMVLSAEMVAAHLTILGRQRQVHVVSTVIFSYRLLGNTKELVLKTQNKQQKAEYLHITFIHILQASKHL